jgi:hypothetical protein
MPGRVRTPKVIDGVLEEPAPKPVRRAPTDESDALSELANGARDLGALLDVVSSGVKSASDAGRAIAEASSRLGRRIAEAKRSRDAGRTKRR